MTSTLTYILLGIGAQVLLAHPVGKWQGVIRSTFIGTTFMISTQNLIGSAQFHAINPKATYETQ